MIKQSVPSNSEPSHRVDRGTGRVRFCLIFFTLLLLLQVGSAIAAELGLTAKERAWLEQHPVLRLGPAPNFPPFEFFDEDGHYRGIVADFAQLMQQRLGVQFEVVQKPDWNAVVEATQEREVDFWMEAVSTSDRTEYLSFSDPYLILPTLIYVRDPNGREQSLDDYSGRQVIMVKGYASTQSIKKQHPKVRIHEVPSLERGLQMVTAGEADAIVITQAAAEHYLRKLGIDNLGPVGEAGYTYRLGLASRNDWPELHSILVKALASISPAERRKILRSW